MPDETKASGPQAASLGAILATRRAEASRGAQEATGLDEAVLERLVRAFYATARRDPAIGPLFRGIEDWERHIARIHDFWSSVALKTGRYHGQPMAAHAPLGLRPEHFARWLALFEQTAREVCTAEAADYLLERARRIAISLEHGVAFQRGELPRPMAAPGHILAASETRTIP
ncbi:group III truncated hemoglobin [Roseomonas sp. E05]|uniref:group III truncated hemoglobin n=1 Tax=Roseomonas sp. E05 TaxID=3046310 RepID=UPI0024BAEE60|nr:group III truncated hemoglobin [Roseomonas sp. E05]MDJ0390644.1 group III truncated hemoglobin [Roseomonas sp. E05]